MGVNRQEIESFLFKTIKHSELTRHERRTFVQLALPLVWIEIVMEESERLITMQSEELEINLKEWLEALLNVMGVETNTGKLVSILVCNFIEETKKRVRFLKCEERSD